MPPLSEILLTIHYIKSSVICEIFSVCIYACVSVCVHVDFPVVFSLPEMVNKVEYLEGETRKTSLRRFVSPLFAWILAVPRAGRHCNAAPRSTSINFFGGVDGNLSPVHTSNNAEAKFDFVVKNGNNVEATLRLCRKNRSTCSIRQCCFDIVAGVDVALDDLSASVSVAALNLRVVTTATYSASLRHPGASTTSRLWIHR